MRQYLSNVYNTFKYNQKYPISLNVVDVIPRILLKNYRLVSIIPVVSKLFQRKMSDQGHNTEQYLTVIIEAWKSAIDNKGAAGAILTDLSKAFDSLNHDLLTAKLEAYGKGALEFIYDYLKDKTQ